MTNAPVYYRIDNEMATLYLNQPNKRNAISAAMWEALADTVVRLERNPDVGLLIVRGQGELAFSAGADISEFAQVFSTAESTARYNAAVRRGQRVLAEFSKPSIAAIQGVCVGGGCGIALCCDIRLACAGARFGIPPSRLGLVYSFEDTKRLFDLVGPAVAKDMLFTGRLLDDREALRVGLINLVFEQQAFAAGVAAYGRRIMDGSQYSVRGAKAMIDEMAAGADLASDALRERAALSYQGKDFREGYHAFIERRAPRFRWRGESSDDQ